MSQPRTEAILTEYAGGEHEGDKNDPTKGNKIYVVLIV